MGLADSIRSVFSRRTVGGVPVVVGDNFWVLEHSSPAELYRTQPHLRTVITFLARNLAQIPVHCYARRSDSDRPRVTDDPICGLLSAPNSTMTGYDFIQAVVSSLKLYDETFILLTRASRADGGVWDMWPIPTPWVVGRGGGSAFAYDWITVAAAAGHHQRVSADGGSIRFLHWHGWNPTDMAAGVSPIESLTQVLAEQIQAWQYRQQIWARGGRMSGILTRPADAPKWTPETKAKFARSWSAAWSGAGDKAGGTPLLEDGMTYHQVRFNAREEQWAEVCRLSLATVAGVYHVNPTMLGDNAGANYSNVEQFNKMLYTDTLAPDLVRLEAWINRDLVPLVSVTENLYAEFNLQAKLAGDFGEQIKYLQSATGAPILLRSEARARLNLPEIPGSDELIIPLNVLVGGQASPYDSGTQNEKSAAGFEVKSAPKDADVASAAAIFGGFFARQRRTIEAALGAKSAWWDADRWNRELATDLLVLAERVAGEVGVETVEALGFADGFWHGEDCTAFLTAICATRARLINETTRRQIEAALAASDDVALAVGAVFDKAEGARGHQGALSFVNAVSAFATVDAARKLRKPGTVKTWLSKSGNVRDAHLEVAGETVAVGDVFSNGAMWPGDPILPVKEVAGCQCVIRVVVP